MLWSLLVTLFSWLPWDKRYRSEPRQLTVGEHWCFSVGFPSDRETNRIFRFPKGWLFVLRDSVYPSLLSWSRHSQQRREKPSEDHQGLRHGWDWPTQNRPITENRVSHGRKFRLDLSHWGSVMYKLGDAGKIITSTIKFVHSKRKGIFIHIRRMYKDSISLRCQRSFLTFRFYWTPWPLRLRNEVKISARITYQPVVKPRCNGVLMT